MVLNKVNRVAGAALLALALAGSRSAQAEPAKMVLARPLKANTVTTYKTTVKANVQGMDITIVQSQKETVKSVKDNGTAVIETEDLGGTMTLNGADQEQKPGQPTTETRDKLGKLIDFKHEQPADAPFAPEIQKLISGIGELILTDKEVAEGDTWETQLDNPVSKDNKAKVKTTYQGIEKVGGVDLWKFKQVAEAVVNMDGSKMINESVIWINPKDGLMEKTDTKMKDVPTMFGPLDFTLTVQRVKAAAVGEAK